jgi:hypothetical protein
MFTNTSITFKRHKKRERSTQFICSKYHNSNFVQHCYLLTVQSRQLASRPRVQTRLANYSQNANLTNPSNLDTIKPLLNQLRQSRNAVPLHILPLMKATLKSSPGENSHPRSHSRREIRNVSSRRASNGFLCGGVGADAAAPALGHERQVGGSHADYLKIAGRDAEGCAHQAGWLIFTRFARCY